MSRRRRSEKRIVAPDPKYNSTEIVRFTNKLMHGGNKSVVQGILYQVIEELEKKNNKPGKEIFDQALKNVMPTVEVKPRRVGGATYQVPVEVKPARRLITPKAPNLVSSTAVSTSTTLSIALATMGIPLLKLPIDHEGSVKSKSTVLLPGTKAISSIPKALLTFLFKPSSIFTGFFIYSD